MQWLKLWEANIACAFQDVSNGQFWGAYVGFDRRVRAGPNDFTMHPTPDGLQVRFAKPFRQLAYDLVFFICNRT